MRLLLKFYNKLNINPFNISRFEIQGFIYSLIKDTRFNYLHDLKGFKFFCFSNVWVNSKEYNLIISSPNQKLIKTIYYKLKTIDILRLGEDSYTLIEVNLINLPKNLYFAPK